jgi:hypothetical protein
MLPDNHQDRADRTLAERLQALPQPQVPPDLESRLLAAIPARIPVVRKRWIGTIGAISALAAACMLAVLLRREGNDEKTTPAPPVGDQRPLSAMLPAEDLVAFPAERRLSNGLVSATYCWPIQEPLPLRGSLSIPADLLE